MDFDKSLKITVKEQSGRTIVVVVESGSALIGSGGHCDIRLGPELVAVEQIYFDIQPGGVFAEVRASSPRVVVDGVPFQRGRVLDARPFRIGKLEILAELVDRQGGRRKSEDAVRPGLLVVAALVVGVGMYSLIARRGEGENTDYKEAPSLFDTQAAQCPTLTPNATEAVVETWMRDAAGRHERSAFSPLDGVQAVGLYRRAAVCLRRLDRTPEADEVTAQADSLANRLEKDFHVHRVRLYRALNDGDGNAARHEVSLLRGYLVQRGTDFAGWLDYLDRRLGLQGKK